jgi:uncharacterized membrane protein YjjB (DUF3815 family)
MWEELLKAVPIYFSSMVKFILGPVGGYLAKLHMVTTIFATVAGSMTIVLVLGLSGEVFRTRVINKLFRKRKKFSDRNRRFVTIWKRYGILGVSILTPILFTPIGGTILAISFGTPRDKLIYYMFVSSSVWAVILTCLVYIFGNTVVDILG